MLGILNPDQWLSKIKLALPEISSEKMKEPVKETTWTISSFSGLPNSLKIQNGKFSILHLILKTAFGDPPALILEP
jgi:hypothetical protein